MQKLGPLLAFFIGLAFLAGCSTTPKDSGPSPEDSPVDPASVEPLKPKNEPLSKAGNPESYTVFGKTYYPLKKVDGFTQIGNASWYGQKFDGNKTSNGEIYDMYSLSAAHKTLPLPSYVRVTNLKNEKSIIVRVNDRGPFVADRIIDLSYMSALKLGMVGHGTVPVRLEVISADKSSQMADKSAKKVEQKDEPEVEPIKKQASGPYLQAGIFSNQANAKQVKDKITRLDIRPVSIHDYPINGKTAKQVRVGPFENEQQLRTIRKKLLSEHIAVITKKQ